MAIISIVKNINTTVAGNTTVYTNTSNTPVLIDRMSFKVFFPSTSIYGSTFYTEFPVYLAKKQLDGTYIEVPLSGQLFAYRYFSPGDTDNSESYYAEIRANLPWPGPTAERVYYSASLYTADVGSAALVMGAISASFRIEDHYNPSQSKLTVNKDDYIFVKVSGTVSSSIVINFILTASTSLPENKIYKTTQFRGEWKSGGSYFKNQTVLYNNDLYIAIQNNSDVSITATNWHIIKYNALPIKTLTLSSELSTPSGTLSALKPEHLSIGTILSNKTFVNAKINGNIGGTGTTYTSVPALTANATVVLTTGAQTLTNKTFYTPTIDGGTFSALNWTQGGFVVTNNGTFLLTPATRALTAGTNNIIVNDGMHTTCQTTTTAGAAFILALPSPANYPGVCVSLIIKMLAANQTITFSGSFKTARTPSASTTANLTDRYFLISDGSFWYCTQILKGIA
jgi:hypothetical protein